MSLPAEPLNLIIGGIGGQGNIRLSRMIGKILNDKGYLINIGETFGAAQRGGPVFSSMRVSKKRNYGPLIPEGHAHLILSLEPLEALRIICKYGNPEVSCIVNTQPVLPIGVLAGEFNYPDTAKLLGTIQSLSRHCWQIDAGRLAMELGAPIVANIIMLGLLAATRIIPVDLEDVEKEIKSSFPPALIDLNLRALGTGALAAS